jgi:hypothetical protein
MRKPTMGAAMIEIVETTEKPRRKRRKRRRPGDSIAAWGVAAPGSFAGAASCGSIDAFRSPLGGD